MTLVTAPSFWGRATLAFAFAAYAWSMMGINLYLRFAHPPDGPSRALAVFRRMIMGRGVIALGGAAVLAAIVLALYAKERKGWAWAALALGMGWMVGLALLWPV